MSKNLGIFACPDDSLGGKPVPGFGWAGVGISYAANGYYGNWTTFFALKGPFVTTGNGGWLDPNPMSDAAVGRASESIMLAEKHADKVLASYQATNSNDSGYVAGNTSGFAPTCVIAGDNYGGGWGPRTIPNGTRSATALYPYGPDGSVTATHTNLANFTFLDGHAKAMKPSSTDPDPINHPELNMWDATRQ